MSQGPVIASLSAVLLISVAPSSSRTALAAAPTLQSDSPARAAVTRGFRPDDAGRYDAARAEFDQALDQARASRDRAAEAKALLRLGVFLYKHAQYDEARTELLAALPLFEMLGDNSGAGITLHHLGWVAFVHETSEKADEYWTRGLTVMQAARDRRGEVQLLHNRTFVMPPGPERTALLQRVLRLAREIGDARTEAGALYKIGQEQSRDGHYAEALEALQEALRGFERVGADDSVARVLMELARLHVSHGRSDRAQAFDARADALLRRVGDKAAIAEATGVRANMYRESGRLREAVAVQRRALALTMEVGGERMINLERLRLARLYLDCGEPRRAKPLLDEVLGGTDTLTRTMAYDPLGEVYLALGQYEQAREAADLAARTTREPGDRPFMLANRAKADEKLGRNSEALADIDEALQIVEHAREHLVPTDSMKQGYGERLQRLFAVAVELRARLGRPEAALEAAERARARAFLDLLATRRSGSAGAKVRPTASGTLDARNDPAVQSAASATPASVDQLTAIARRLDSVIVSYWVGPTTTLVWIVDGEGHVGSASIRVSARRLASLIGQTSAEIGGAGSPTAKLVADGDTPQVSRGDAMIAAGRTPTHVWRELHELLLRPIQPFLPRARGSLLTIVPHGPLFRLSFAALLDDRGRYLIERYRLHYVPSGGSLLYLKSASSDADAPIRYLLVGDPAERADLSKAALPPLPGAAREVAAIARMLPRGTATVLTGARVTEDRVRHMVGSHEVLHLATHAVLRDDRPFDSFLALGGRGRDAATDGRLTTADIYGLHLNADLVVLSACQSARGPVTGDGVLGMTRAFMYAGAAAIVATLWDVADQSGAELMPAFYRAWRRERSRSAALREAQLQLLARLRAGTVTIDTPGGPRTLPEHPFFWAGFVLVGEP
jgi:CHAT domain-containing protein/tetratricopeptide (TPR) repeat protein